MRNREIKFRAWNHHLKVMMPNNSIPVAAKNLSNDNGTMIYMQSTGLLDGNNLDVWEGDIVRCYEGARPHGALETIVFEDGAFRFAHRLINPTDWERRMNEKDDGTPYSYEVIGNIYENPELL